MISRTLDLPGQTLHYADFGGEGPTVVLVHGLGGAHTNWLAVGAQLARRGRVVAVDLPGFGRSPRSPRGTSMRVLGEALQGFVDAMSTEPVVLMGNSMGGALAILEAYSRPQRVEGMLLVCPALPPVPGTRVDPGWMGTLAMAAMPGGHLLLRMQASKVGPEKHVRELLDLCCVDATRIPPEIVEAHLALARERASILSAQQSFAEASRSLMGHLMLGRTLRRALRAGGPKALIVHGQGDRLVDVRASRAVAAANPRFELKELPGVGHVPQLETPDAFVEIALGWLERLVTTRAA
jgi:pimeloyl-ACP methyl ester carboxylesterase